MVWFIMILLFLHWEAAVYSLNTVKSILCKAPDSVDHTWHLRVTLRVLRLVLVFYWTIEFGQMTLYKV